jgi:hypothetical protein
MQLASNILFAIGVIARMDEEPVALLVTLTPLGHVQDYLNWRNLSLNVCGFY